MSDPNDSQPQRNLQQHALVDQLRPDPAQPVNAIAISGYPGRGSEPGTWRIYLTPALDDYLKVNEGDIVSIQQQDTPASGLSPSLVFVKADAKIEHVHITTAQAQASFLSGALTSGFMPSSGARSMSAGLVGAAAYAKMTYLGLCQSDCGIALCKYSDYPFSHVDWRSVCYCSWIGYPGCE